MTHKFTFDTALIRNEGRRDEYEIEVSVTYSVTEGAPARLYGDYPQPADDGEVEILSVKANGAEIDTSREEDDRLYDLACDRADSDLADWANDRDEYHADMIRDFQREERA